MIPEPHQIASGASRHREAIEIIEDRARRRDIIVPERRLQPFQHSASVSGNEHLRWLAGNRRASPTQRVNRAENHGGLGFEIGKQMGEIPVVCAARALERLGCSMKALGAKIAGGTGDRVGMFCSRGAVA